MSTVNFKQHGVAAGDQREPISIRRIGQIAGVLSIAIAIFACLYFLILYIASE